MELIFFILNSFLRFVSWTDQRKDCYSYNSVPVLPKLTPTYFSILIFLEIPIHHLWWSWRIASLCSLYFLTSMVLLMLFPCLKCTLDQSTTIKLIFSFQFQPFLMFPAQFSPNYYPQHIHYLYSSNEFLLY